MSSKITRYVLPVDQAELRTPYIGIVETGEREQVRDATYARYVLSLSWFIIVERAVDDIQDIIRNLKLYIYSASIANMRAVRFIGTEIVHVEDLNEDRYGSVRMDVEIIYWESLT